MVARKVSNALSLRSPLSREHQRPRPDRAPLGFFQAKARGVSQGCRPSARSFVSDLRIGFHRPTHG
jgi:hypothetical protein